MIIDIEGSVSRSLGSSGGSTTVEVSVAPRAKTKSTERHVALLIDTSASMDGEKIKNAKNGAKNALDHLEETDYVSITGFNSDTDVILPMSKWGMITESEAKNDIDDIQAGGGTDIYNGLETVRDQLVQDTPSSVSAIKRIILLSDGQDRYDAKTYRNLASDFDDDGISIIAAGIGDAYDDSVILALANASGGTPANLSGDDIDEFLENTVGDTDGVVASNPTLEIDPRHGFLVDEEPVQFNEPKFQERDVDTDGSPATVKLPELELGGPHRLTFEMLGQPKSTGIEHELADLRVVDSAGSTLAETVLHIKYTESGALEHADIEKSRSLAKGTTDIQDPDTSDAEVRTAIDKMEERGWTDTADDLKEKLDTADEDGGLIKISQSGANDT